MGLDEGLDDGLGFLGEAEGDDEVGGVVVGEEAGVELGDLLEVEAGVALVGLGFEDEAAEEDVIAGVEHERVIGVTGDGEDGGVIGEFFEEEG